MKLRNCFRQITKTPNSSSPVRRSLVMVSRQISHTRVLSAHSSAVTTSRGPVQRARTSSTQTRPRLVVSASRLSQRISIQKRAFSSQSPKTAVLMLNMGGPETTKDVGSFLTNLFSDTQLMKLPFQPISAPLIAKRRTPQIEKQYSEIGGGSPIRKWTEKQGQLMCEKLNSNPTLKEFGPFKSFPMFRYAAPMGDEVLQQIASEGIRNFVLFSQYPQYSCSTTGSSLVQFRESLQKLNLEPQIDKITVIDRWATHPALIKAFAKKVREGLEMYPPEERDSVIVLFSAHSLPMRAVNRGDPYPQEVGSTVAAVMKEVWQSKVGPLPWLGPQTSEAIEGYSKQGIKNMLTVPIAFTSDHIETLYELDIEYGHHLAEKLGVTGLKRAPSLNDDPLFIDALAQVVTEQLVEKKRSSLQLSLSCPNCKGGSCKESRFWVIEKQAQNSF